MYLANVCSGGEYCSVISWLISVIIDARSQSEYAKRDKLEGDDDDVSK